MNDWNEREIANAPKIINTRLQLIAECILSALYYPWFGVEVLPKYSISQLNPVESFLKRCEIASTITGSAVYGEHDLFEPPFKLVSQ